MFGQNPGFSGGFNERGGNICYTNSSGSMTGCIYGSHENGGTAGFGFTFRF